MGAWASPLTSDVCALAIGDVATWTGLVPFALDAAPPCLGEPVVEDVRRIGTVLRPYREHRTGDGSDVRLVGDDSGMVVLVEAAPATPPDPPPGVPDLVLPLPFAAYLHDPGLDGYGSRVADHVYAALGLAVLVVEDGRVVRLRGFVPVAADAYVALFRTYPSVEFDLGT